MRLEQGEGGTLSCPGRELVGGKLEQGTVLRHLQARPAHPPEFLGSKADAHRGKGACPGSHAQSGACVSLQGRPGKSLVRC